MHIRGNSSETMATEVPLPKDPLETPLTSGLSRNGSGLGLIHRGGRI
jgi:hypothetical protein